MSRFFESFAGVPNASDNPPLAPMPEDPRSPSRIVEPPRLSRFEDPRGVSPLVVWLGSTESKSVTGCTFEVAGGKISLADGWRAGPQHDKGARLEPDEIGGVVHDLLEKAVPPQKVYGT